MLNGVFDFFVHVLDILFGRRVQQLVFLLSLRVCGILDIIVDHVNGMKNRVLSHVHTQKEHTQMSP